MDKASVFVPAYDKESGLGFWICREFFRAMGGGIGLVSLSDPGPIEFTLPVPQGMADAMATTDSVDILEDVTTPSTGVGSPTPLGLRANAGLLSSDELCCLVLDLPIVTNENSLQFVDHFMLLSSPHSGPCEVIMSLINRVTGKKENTRVFPGTGRAANGLVARCVSGDSDASGVEQDETPGKGSPALEHGRSSFDLPGTPVSDKCEPPFVDIPLSAGPPLTYDQQTNSHSNSQSNELAAMNTDLKILIIDDSKLVRNVLCKMLRGRPQLISDVVEAEEGTQGVDFVLKSMHDGEPFDVVLLDYHMPPGIDGPLTKILYLSLYVHNNLCIQAQLL